LLALHEAPQIDRRAGTAWGARRRTFPFPTPCTGNPRGRMHFREGIRRPSARPLVFTAEWIDDDQITAVFRIIQDSLYLPVVEVPKQGATSRSYRADPPRFLP